MNNVSRTSRPAATASPGWGKRSRVLGLALLTAVGLSACVEVPPGPAYEPGVSVGVSFYQPTYPNMVLVPGYPVYYYPYGNANYFFYGGTYWLYQGDRWYSSNWYNGPWSMTGPQYVPYYLLQVPVRYYRAPPPWFHGWHADESPHWGEHWGRDWEEHHRGWNEPDRTIPPAPLPKYQAAYTGNRYPHDRVQQDQIRNQNYHYESHDSVTPPASRPSERPSYSPQEQGQPHGPPAAAPKWQPQQQQEPPAPQYQAPTQHPTPPQYQPPHEPGEWQQRSPPSPAPQQSQRPEPQQQEDRPNHSQGHWPPSTTPSQSQPAPANRQWTTGTPSQTQPHQEQHRESPPPASSQPPHPAPQHSQATPPSQESSAPPPKGQAKKPPPPDKSGDNQDDQR